eukprot:1226269-Amphidinium_carterae.2
MLNTPGRGRMLELPRRVQLKTATHTVAEQRMCVAFVFWYMQVFALCGRPLFLISIQLGFHGKRVREGLLCSSAGSLGPVESACHTPVQTYPHTKFDVCPHSLCSFRCQASVAILDLLSEQLKKELRSLPPCAVRVVGMQDLGVIMGNERFHVGCAGAMFLPVMQIHPLFAHLEGCRSICVQSATK